MSGISKRWCFTLNNHTDDEVSSIQNWDIKYLVFGFEKGENETPHLQGFVVFKKQYRISGLKKLNSRIHWEITQGTSQQAADYCKKEGDFWESGTLNEQGKRTDLEAFKDAVKNGTLDHKVLREQHSSVFARYPRFCIDYVTDHRVPLKPESHPLREWQADLYKKLEGPPNDREIVFAVDINGNSGKTWFCKYYCYLHDKAFYMRPTKVNDMSYAVPDDIKVLFLDCTRQQLEFLPYSFLESVKDGLLFSPKYESRMKMLGKVHVVVMMNQEPDYDKLSHDRYNVIKLKE